MQTYLAIGPAGDVWVMNNWQDIDSCLDVPDETLSTRCGGQGVVIFFGMRDQCVRRRSVRPGRIRMMTQWHLHRAVASRCKLSAADVW